MASLDERQGNPPGAYGFCIDGLAEAGPLLGDSGTDWPELQVVRRRADAPHAETVVAEDFASHSLGRAIRADMERHSRTVTFVSPLRLSDGDVVHPCLAPAAALFAHWLGREPFHGGAVMLAEGAWGVLGHRESGKSTLLAALACAGHPVLADDLLVIHAGRALRGPRCIDLRPVAASALRLGRDLPRVRAGSRRRMLLPAAEPEAALRGWLFPTWGPDCELVPVRPRERLGLLMRHRTWALNPSDPPALLELASLPAFELRRPRRLEALPQVTRYLLAELPA
jgi:hypothetical protein